MFDRTIYAAPPSTTINVKQQPNDAADAARLYGECRAKAEAEVADAIIVKFGARNELTGIKIESQRTFFDDKTHVRLLFSINGEKFDIQGENDSVAMTRVAYREAVTILFEKVVEKMFPPSFPSIKGVSDGR